MKYTDILVGAGATAGFGLGVFLTVKQNLCNEQQNTLDDVAIIYAKTLGAYLLTGALTVTGGLFFKLVEKLGEELSRSPYEPFIKKGP